MFLFKSKINAPIIVIRRVYFRFAYNKKIVIETHILCVCELWNYNIYSRLTNFNIDCIHFRTMNLNSNVQRRCMNFWFHMWFNYSKWLCQKATTRCIGFLRQRNRYVHIQWKQNLSSDPSNIQMWLCQRNF